MKKVKLAVLIAFILMSAGISYAQHNHSGKDTLNIDKAIDPVCGMTVGKSDSLKVFYNEKDYYFCSMHDELIFLKSPQKYTDGKMGSQMDNKMGNHDEHSDGIMGMSSTLMYVMLGVMVAGMATYMMVRK